MADVGTVPRDRENGRPRTGRRRRNPVERKVTAFIRSTYNALSVPVVVLFLFHNRRIRREYAMTWRKKVELGWRMYRNTRRIPTATSYRAHLAMAVKLLEVPPTQRGVVVECGCFVGGSTANLSLVCDIVGRDLIVYDSFEGLPAAEANDKYADPIAEGQLRGELEIVKDNVRRFGAIERCSFRKGWFRDTLPGHQEPIVMCFLDVDFQASLHDCVRYLWPHLAPKGYVFIDEYVYVDYCALFFSERWWRTYLGTTPPGLVGSGSGVGVGQFYIGPYHERQPIQQPNSIAYTRKDFSGMWDYYPEEMPPVRPGASGRETPDDE